MMEEQQKKRYESDMTWQDKRQLEKEKLAAMTWKEKIDYIWTYYKLWMAAAVVVVALIVMIGQIIYKAQFESVCTILAINNPSIDSEALAADLKEYLGDEEKYDTVEVDASVTFSDSGTDDEEGTEDYTSDYNMVMKVTAVFASGDCDVVIAPREWIDYYMEQEAFAKISDIFTEEELEEAGYETAGDYALALPEDTRLADYDGWGGGDVCVAVTSFTKNEENAKQAIAFLMGASEENTTEGEETDE